MRTCSGKIWGHRAEEQGPVRVPGAARPGVTEPQASHCDLPQSSLPAHQGRVSRGDRSGPRCGIPLFNRPSRPRFSPGRPCHIHFHLVPPCFYPGDCQGCFEKEPGGLMGSQGHAPSGVPNWMEGPRPRPQAHRTPGSRGWCRFTLMWLSGVPHRLLSPEVCREKPGGKPPPICADSPAFQTVVTHDLVSSHSHGVKETEQESSPSVPAGTQVHGAGWLPGVRARGGAKASSCPLST